MFNIAEGMNGLATELTRRLYRKLSSISASLWCRVAAVSPNGAGSTPGVGSSVTAIVPVPTRASESHVESEAKPAHIADEYETETHRMRSLDWLATSPLPRTLAGRLVLEPLRKYQGEYTALNKMDARRTAQLQQLFDMDNATLCKSVPMNRIISGQMEAETIDKFLLLLDDAIW